MNDYPTGCGIALGATIIICAIFCGVAYSFGMKTGAEIARKECQTQAVESGAAEWVVDKGEVTSVKWRVGK